MTQLLIPAILITQMENSARAKHVRNESGGLLLGFRKGTAIEVTAITFPQARDKASPTLFRRSTVGHKAKALKAWKESGETTDWVGEWHTHPNGAANPSFIDRMSWRKITQHTKQPMAFIIIGAATRFVGWQASSLKVAVSMNETESDGVHLLYSS